MSELHLEPRHLAMVREILARYAPGRAVWAFGSRATGRRLKPFSDLDLAVEGELPPGDWMEMVDAFDDAPLPMKVDIVEMGRLSAEFHDRIEKDFVAVQGEANGFPGSDDAGAIGEPRDWVAGR